MFARGAATWPRSSAAVADAAARSAAAASPAVAAEQAAIEAALAPLAAFARDVPIRLRASAGWKPGNSAVIWVVGELGVGQESTSGADAECDAHERRRRDRCVGARPNRCRGAILPRGIDTERTARAWRVHRAAAHSRRGLVCRVERNAARLRWRRLPMPLERSSFAAARPPATATCRRRICDSGAASTSASKCPRPTAMSPLGCWTGPVRHWRFPSLRRSAKTATVHVG